MVEESDAAKGAPLTTGLRFVTQFRHAEPLLPPPIHFYFLRLAAWIVPRELWCKARTTRCESCTHKACFFLLYGRCHGSSLTRLFLLRAGQR